jgi:hypothetical protein
VGQALDLKGPQACFHSALVYVTSDAAWRDSLDVVCITKCVVGSHCHGSMSRYLCVAPPDPPWSWKFDMFVMAHALAAVTASAI